MPGAYTAYEIRGVLTARALYKVTVVCVVNLRLFNTLSYVTFTNHTPDAVLLLRWSV